MVTLKEKIATEKSLGILKKNNLICKNMQKNFGTVKAAKCEKKKFKLCYCQQTAPSYLA